MMRPTSRPLSAIPMLLVLFLHPAVPALAQDCGPNATNGGGTTYEHIQTVKGYLVAVSCPPRAIDFTVELDDGTAWQQSCPMGNFNCYGMDSGDNSLRDLAMEKYLQRRVIVWDCRARNARTDWFKAVAMEFTGGSRARPEKPEDVEHDAGSAESPGADQGVVVSDRGGESGAPAATRVEIQGADCGWQAIGVELADGEEVRVSAEGVITFAPAAARTDPNGCRLDQADPCGAARRIPGGGDVPAPDLWQCALVGRIGEGEPFLVGSNVGFRADTAGPFYLAYNDSYCGDNSGSFEVSIKRSPMGAGVEEGVSGEEPNGPGTVGGEGGSGVGENAETGDGGQEDTDVGGGSDVASGSSEAGDVPCTPGNSPGTGRGAGTLGGRQSLMWHGRTVLTYCWRRSGREAFYDLEWLDPEALPSTRVVRDGDPEGYVIPFMIPRVRQGDTIHLRLRQLPQVATWPWRVEVAATRISGERLASGPDVTVSFDGGHRITASEQNTAVFTLGEKKNWREFMAAYQDAVDLDLNELYRRAMSGQMTIDQVLDMFSDKPYFYHGGDPFEATLRIGDLGSDWGGLGADIEQAGLGVRITVTGAAEVAAESIIDEAMPDARDLLLRLYESIPPGGR